MSLSRQFCGTVKPPALIFVKSGYSRSCNRSFRISMGSRNLQAGLYCRPESTPKIREAVSTPSPRRSMSINSIFSSFRFHSRPPDGLQSVKSGQNTTNPVLSMLARRMAALNILGLDITADMLNILDLHITKEMLVEAAMRPAVTLLIGLHFSKLLRRVLMPSECSIRRRRCIRESLQCECNLQGAHSQLKTLSTQVFDPLLCR